MNALFSNFCHIEGALNYKVCSMRRQKRVGDKSVSQTLVTVFTIFLELVTRNVTAVSCVTEGDSGSGG